MSKSAYERYIQELEAICIRNSVIEHDSLEGLTLEQKLNFFHRMNDVFRLLDIGGLNLFNGELTFQTYREIAVKQINDEYNKEFDKAVSELRNSETNKRMEELTNDLISGNYFNRIKDYKPKTPLIQRETIVSSDESIGSEDESVYWGTQTNNNIEEEHEITANDFFSQGFMASMLEDDGSNYVASDEDSEVEYSDDDNVGQDVDDLFSNLSSNPDFYGSGGVIIEDDYEDTESYDEEDDEDDEVEETELSDEDLDSYFSEIEEDSDEDEDYDDEDSINSYLKGIVDECYDEDDGYYGEDDEESEDDSINSYLNGIEDEDDYEEDEEESEGDIDSYLDNIEYDEEDEDEDVEDSEDDIDSYLNNVEYEEEDEYEGQEEGYSSSNSSYYQNQTLNKFENQSIKEVKSELNAEPHYKTSFEKEDKSVDRLTNLADSVITRFFNKNKSGGK